MTEPVWIPAEPDPDSGPSEMDVANRVRFEELLAASPSGLQSSAEKWSSGLIALIGVVSAGLVLKGPPDSADIQQPWRWALIACSVFALSLAVVALWRLLYVAARRFTIVDRAALLDRPGEFEHLRAQASARDATTINRAIQMGAAAVTLQVIGIAIWWAVPTASTGPAAYLSAVTGEKTVCGELISGDKGVLRIQVEGERDPRDVALASLTNLRVVDEC